MIIFVLIQTMGLLTMYWVGALEVAYFLKDGVGYEL